uniref:Centrosomal protein 131 n=1 Tax=Sphaeramia orbicularis TaxID=375764 RepID=A0A672YF22_9TELE
MHPTRSPASISAGVPGDALDLSLSGSQLTMSKRPSSASPGKCFARSVSVSVAGESRAKRNTLSDAALGSSRSIKNLRRSNSTTQVNQAANASPDHGDDYLALFDSSSDGRRKLASLSKASPDRTTWNILDDQPRALAVASSSRSAGSVDSPTGLKKRELGFSLAATFTANNRSNKGAMGNSVTTILHNNYSEKPLTPKSSNQKPSFNNILKANDEVSLENGSLTKSQKNFSSSSSTSNNNTPLSAQRDSPVPVPFPVRRREVSEEEAERFIEQVNQAAVTIQRWYRRYAKRRRTNQAALKRILSTKRKEWEDRAEEEDVHLEQQQKKKDEDRKRIREEKARLARLAAIQELQQKRSQRSAETHREPETEAETLRHSGRKRANNSPLSPSPSKAKNTDSNLNVVSDFSEVSFRAVSPASSHHRGSECSQEILQRSVSVEDQRQGALSSRAQSKTTLNELLDTLKLLEEEPERLSEPKSYRKDKYAWIDQDGDATSLTADNLERHGQMSLHPALPDGGALLSEAKLQSIMSFLDEMEKSEQERPRSVTSGSHREAVLSEEELVGAEQASATAAELSGSMMRTKLELEEKKRTVHMLQTALAQQRELTTRHVKDTEKELSRSFQLQKEQYEATIQRHLAFIDQLISDKKALSERCEGVVSELKQVDHKYMQKISQMQEQHDMVWQILGPLCEEIKKLKELMSATEKVRREKWIDEKTKKIKEITVKGLEPEIQKLISKHKQELKRLRTLHEAELLQADERAAQRFVRQSEELRQQLEKDKDEQCQRERDAARQRYEKQLQEEELSLQQQRRRLYKEVADEKDRLAQMAERQRAELEDVRRQLEENSCLAERALRRELDQNRDEQEERHQAEMKALQERLDAEKQAWEENYKHKEVCLRPTELKSLHSPRCDGRNDRELNLAILAMEAEVTKDKEECERGADGWRSRVRVKRVRDKYEAELKELERSEKAAVEKQQELRKRQLETEGELIRLQSLLRQKEQEVEDVTKARDKMAAERRSLAEVIRQDFADRLVLTEEENRRMKAEVSEVRARLRLEVERVTREKEEELAEVHQR